MPFLSLLLEIGTCPRKSLAGAPPSCSSFTRDCPREREREREREKERERKGKKEGGAEKPKRGTDIHRWKVEGKADKSMGKYRRRIQGKCSGNTIPRPVQQRLNTHCLLQGGRTREKEK
ncbi:hypothetical protein AMECASPLE_003715 [Ameca splendens]|uniref:Uncharacterized protein n=1 Tax=Ameca splendens TaxID=208324 RepID=A0ABV0XBP3_9TELE